MSDYGREVQPQEDREREAREHRLHNAEIKLAYLEGLLEDLNEVVTAQQDELDKLMRTVDGLRRKLSAFEEEDAP